MGLPKALSDLMSRESSHAHPQDYSVVGTGDVRVAVRDTLIQNHQTPVVLEIDDGRVDRALRRKIKSQKHCTVLLVVSENPILRWYVLVAVLCSLRTPTYVRLYIDVRSYVICAQPSTAPKRRNTITQTFC